LIFRGILTFSNKTNDLIEKTLNIQYIKRLEQEKCDFPENFDELSEKLTLLKKKDNNLDRTLKEKDSDKKATVYKLIHQYNELKVFFHKKIIKFNRKKGLLFNNSREIS